MKSIWCFGVLFFMLSCGSYYNFVQPAEELDDVRVYKMLLKDGYKDFRAYSDYYHDTIDLDRIYLTNREARKIKNTTSGGSGSRQILFLHNDTDYYLNIIGYYHPNLYLKEIKTPRLDFRPILLTNGKGFYYVLEHKPVAEFFVPYKTGMLHFIASGDPNVYESNPNRFEKELDYVFFLLNRDKFRLIQ